MNNHLNRHWLTMIKISFHLHSLLSFQQWRVSEKKTNHYRKIFVSFFFFSFYRLTELDRSSSPWFSSAWLEKRRKKRNVQMKTNISSFDRLPSTEEIRFTWNTCFARWFWANIISSTTGTIRWSNEKISSTCRFRCYNRSFRSRCHLKSDIHCWWNQGTKSSFPVFFMSHSIKFVKNEWQNERTWSNTTTK